jgi:TrmH family RNA methyltransferase
VVLTERSVDVHNPKVVRATAGALLRLPVAEGANATELLSAASAAGVPSWATVKDGGTSLDDAALVGACLLVVGSEAHGLPGDVVAAATCGLTIPMDGTVESLNAAVAGSLVAFEAARQRRTGAGPTGELRQNVNVVATTGDPSTHEERPE